MDKIQVCSNKLIVDTNALKHNINEIRKQLDEGTNIIPVIKANAYGIGIEKMLEVVMELGITIVAVATVDEGIYLRQLGYDGEVFILNQPCISQIGKIAEYELTVGISSMLFIDELEKHASSFNVHLEIGTGMGRTGINPYRCTEVLDKILACKNIKVIRNIYSLFL